MMKRALYAVGAILLLIVLYFLFAPVPVDPAGWTPPELPPAEGVYAENDLLTETEVIAPDYHGGESIDFDSEGRLYTGLGDGRIIRMDQDGNNAEIFAEAIEPTGLEFDQDDNLIVADATQGLLSINPQGEITVLIPAGPDEDFFYFNDLAIASDGKIYISHASTKFGKYEFVYETLEHRPYGSLWVYDPATGETEMLLDGLYFANGVALSPDEDFVLVSENTAYRVTRYWLKGEKAGKHDTFIENLPGFPDNITTNGEDIFWIPLAGGRASRETADGLLPYPFIIKIAMKLPQAIQPAPTHQGVVLGLDLEGNIVHNLQDPKGEVFYFVTSAIEREGMLYLGSLEMDGLGRIAVPE